MCGIAGMINLSCSQDTVRSMISTMLRRGPDENGYFQKDDCTLLHSRLAIIDVDNGKQPMTFSWAGEDYTIVYNGEIYNTEELRNLLIRLGHSFRGHSDTEVLLHGYVQWGSGIVHKINGIFAFAVWKHNEHKLFLARDRMGVKPLFYMFHGGGILFASEMKTILAYPSVRAEVDAVGISEMLLIGPGRTPGSGVFRNMQELEPGWCASYTGGKWHAEQYWKLRDGEHTDSLEQTVEKVRWLVTDSIRRQMISDVPIGTFLSGGLDSSIISAVCAEEMKKKNKQLITFSVDYANNDKFFVPGKFQPNSDNMYIQIMNEYLSCDHTWTVLAPEDLLEVMADATIARDLPGMADIDFSLLAFCKHIRSKVKVALSGECADEIFGGYPWYRDPEIRALAGFPWAQNTKYRASFISKEILDQIDAEDFVYSRYHQTIAESDILSGASPQDRRIKEMVNLNLRWFMQTLLDRKDRMSMYWGLEVRVPFCDYRIAEYLYTVPWEYKEYGGKEKGVLRHAMEGILPETILYRKKSPYPKTFDPNYLNLVSDMLRSVIADKNAPIHQVVCTEALTALLDAEYTWPWYGQLMRVPQTIAFMLQINFWLKHYSVSIV